MFEVSSCARVWFKLKLNWKKNHTTAGIIFCLKNTCAQICAQLQGPGRADCQGFRSSCLLPLDLTTLVPKGSGGEVLLGVGLVYINSCFSPKTYVFLCFFGNLAVFP